MNVAIIGAGPAGLVTARWLQEEGFRPVLFEQGEHGMGMRDGLANASYWPRRAEEWLRSRGLLTPSATNAAQAK